jgi:hypothetical protein
MEASTAVRGLLQLQMDLQVMLLALLVTGLMLPISLPVAMVLLLLLDQAGILLDPLQHSTEMHMATLQLVVVAAVAQEDLHVVVEPVSGEMANTLLVQPTLVKSVSFSA